MKVKVVRNYSGNLIERNYDVSQDFFEIVNEYALPTTERPEWWLIYDDAGKENFIGFKMDPMFYYEMRKEGRIWVIR